jgi:tetratricopeptide (TPR) repeat protein
MKVKFLTILFFYTFQNTLSQNFQTDFLKEFKKNDMLRQREILERWEKVKPDEAELFTSYFNYYMKLSRKDKAFNQKHFDLGIDKINMGIQLHPNRLDMRFGKIHTYGLIKDWEKFTKIIIETINYSSINNNEWIWTNNKKKENGEEFFLSALQNYQVQLYNTNNQNLLINMREIAKKILEFYPNHITSLSNLSITYMLTGEVEKGIEPLLKAQKIAPKDPVVMNNIAHGYKLKGDKKKAIKYYKKTIKYADERGAKHAKQQIEILREPKR